MWTEGASVIVCSCIISRLRHSVEIAIDLFSFMLYMLSSTYKNQRSLSLEGHISILLSPE